MEATKTMFEDAVSRMTAQTARLDGRVEELSESLQAQKAETDDKMWQQGDEIEKLQAQHETNSDEIVQMKDSCVCMSM